MQERCDLNHRYRWYSQKIMQIKAKKVIIIESFYALFHNYF